MECPKTPNLLYLIHLVKRSQTVYLLFFFIIDDTSSSSNSSSNDNNEYINLYSSWKLVEKSPISDWSMTYKTEEKLFPVNLKNVVKWILFK